MSRIKDKTSVRHREYGELLDFSGKNLFALLDHPKAEVAELTGGLAAKSEMAIVAVPAKAVTAMSGDVADELHEWPCATLGQRFHHLVLLFVDDRLLEFRWKTPPMHRPWYRRLLRL
jgi:hypothetical protein